MRIPKPSLRKSRLSSSRSAPFTQKWLLAGVLPMPGDFRRSKMATIQFEAPRHRVGAVPRRSRGALAGIAGRVLTTLREWRRRAHDRAQLAKLDHRMLRDIGLTQADAEFLSSKP